MFIFDQLKREDRQLQVVALVILLGMGVLLSGVWYVQIACADRYTDNMNKQTFRSVRVPGLRGKILDRNGLPLAENRPVYNIDIYLEDVLAQYNATNTVRRDYLRQHPGAKINAAARKEIERTRQQGRYEIISNITVHASSILGQPVAPSPDRFFYHLKEWTYMPFPIMRNLDSKQLALYYEQLSNESSIDLEIQPLRTYPNGSVAAHFMGYVRSQDSPEDDDDIPFQYYLPYWKGKTGLEYAYDADLRGKPGIKWVLVNNYSFRQREEMKTPAEAGDNLHLTLDLNIQIAAEKALSQVLLPGAVVVMDVRNGDILAMASSPTYDPNRWTGRISSEEFAHLNDPQLRPMFNRTTGAYLPGSIFKIITAIACLENGLNPKEIYQNKGYYALSATSRIKDTADPGDYDFDRAFYESSNSYFIYHGLKAGTRKILEVGKRFHLGESTELGVGPESSGSFPRPEEAAGLWIQSDVAFTSIGQKTPVTPVQAACFISAIANGGTLYWPRVVSHLVSPETGEIDPEKKVEKGRVRDVVSLNPKHLDIIRHAMVLDTEHPDASAHDAFFHRDGTPKSPLLANFRVAGKTGTAERDEFGVRDKVTWFASYGPYENPRYAVIVMVEGGASGGKTCAPVAQEIYKAIVKSEQTVPTKPLGKLADAYSRRETITPLN